MGWGAIEQGIDLRRACGMTHLSQKSSKSLTNVRKSVTFNYKEDNYECFIADMG